MELDEEYKNFLLEIVKISMDKEHPGLSKKLKKFESAEEDMHLTSHFELGNEKDVIRISFKIEIDEKTSKPILYWRVD